MLNLIIPDTEVNVEDCELHCIVKAVGGRLLIKELPPAAITSCTQVNSGCYELADYVVLMLSSDESEDMLCTLCGNHLAELLKLQELAVPVLYTH